MTQAARDDVGNYNCQRCGFHTNTRSIFRAHAVSCDGTGKV